MTLIESLRNEIYAYDNNTDLTVQYRHKLEQLDEFYYDLDFLDLDILHTNILAIYMFGNMTEQKKLAIYFALIDFMYYIAEEQIELKKLTPFKSIVIAYALLIYESSLRDYKLKIWINDALINGLLEITDDLESVIRYVLEFQNKCVRPKNLKTFINDGLDYEILSDQEIIELIPSYLIEIKGKRRIKEHD